jgi:hypothetical protein
MPRIDSQLTTLIQNIRSGQQELNAETAREIISNVTADGRVYESEEVAQLRGLDSMAPAGSVHGRELLKNFVEGAEGRLRSADQRDRLDYFSPRSDTNPVTRFWGSWMRMNPFLSAFSVPKPKYATTEAKDSYTRTLSDQTELNTRRDLVGEKSLATLVEKYEGAYDTRFGYDLSVTTIPNDDIYQVYKTQVQDQPIHEHNPLGAVESYLDANYTRKP